MPVTYEYMKDGGILVKGEDLVTGNEIKGINDGIYGSLEEIMKIRYQLWDLRNVSKVIISNDDIVTYAKQDAAAARVNSNMIIAIVANKDLLFGLSRMWEAHSYTSPIQSMVFRKIEEAEKWIDTIMEKS